MKYETALHDRLYAVATDEVRIQRVVGDPQGEYQMHRQTVLLLRRDEALRLLDLLQVWAKEL